MKLLAPSREGSGAVNEDGFGFAGDAKDVSAAWIFDGVTGINRRTIWHGGSDAQWLVARAHGTARRTGAAATCRSTASLRELVDGLIADWNAASGRARPAAGL